MEGSMRKSMFSLWGFGVMLLCVIQTSAFELSNANYTCWGQETCCDVWSFYVDDSYYRINLDTLLSKIQNARKVPEQSPRGRVSQFLTSPEDSADSPEPAYGAWLCVEDQTVAECQACIDDLLDEIWEGFENLPSCNRSAGIQAVGSGAKCRVRYDRFQFWNPSDTCQPLCCSVEPTDESFLSSYKGNVLRAWKKAQAQLKAKSSDDFELSYRDYYDPTEEEAVEELDSRAISQYRPVVFIGYDCAPGMTGAECLRCVDSLVLSLDHWLFREGEHCDDAVGMTANDDHSYYYENPHEEPGANVVSGGPGDWPAGKWPRGSCKFFFDNKPHYNSLYL